MKYYLMIEDFEQASNLSNKIKDKVNEIEMRRNLVIHFFHSEKKRKVWAHSS